MPCVVYEDIPDRSPARPFWREGEREELAAFFAHVGLTDREAQLDAHHSITCNIHRCGGDGYGDMPEGMSRVQYWAQHLDMAKLLGEQEKRAAKEAAKEACPTCHKKFVTLSRHKCKKRPRTEAADEE